MVIIRANAVAKLPPHRFDGRETSLTAHRKLRYMSTTSLEQFVDAYEAGKFLSLKRRRILELARARKLPGHPIGDGARRVWRFRLSELATAVSSTEKPWFSSRQRTSMVRPKFDVGTIGTEG